MNRKNKKNENNMQTNGGCWPQFWRFDCSNLAHYIEASFDFSDHVPMRWLGCSLDLDFWPLDGRSWPPGRPLMRVHGGSLRDMLRRNKLKKKNMKDAKGTWESNPGPNVYHANALPIVLFSFFVNIIGYE